MNQKDVDFLRWKMKTKPKEILLETSIEAEAIEQVIRKEYGKRYYIDTRNNVFVLRIF